MSKYVKFKIGINSYVRGASNNLSGSLIAIRKMKIISQIFCSFRKLNIFAPLPHFDHRVPYIRSSTKTTSYEEMLNVFSNGKQRYRIYPIWYWKYIETVLYRQSVYIFWIMHAYIFFHKTYVRTNILYTREIHKIRYHLLGIFSRAWLQCFSHLLANVTAIN